MTAKVTVIADKDIGPVLGAVTEVTAEAKLKVDQVVAASGFPIRSDVQVTLLVPSTELETFLTAAEGALVDPRSYVVIDGVPTALPAALTIQSVALKSSAVEISFGTAPPPSVNADIKVKAILHRRSDDATEVLAPPPVRPVSPDPRITFGANLRTAERYDVLVLVEGYRSFFQEDVLVQ